MKNTIICALLAWSLLLSGLMPGHAKSSAFAATAETQSAKTNLVDINTATAKELEALKGIGPKTAAKIIAGRPYKAKDELVEKKIVTKAQYQLIKDFIIAKQPKKSKTAT